MNPKESNSSAKLKSLKKALKKELNQPRPDKERVQMLDIEITKLDPDFKIVLTTK